MKKYILRGNDSDVDKVVRENRIRVARGLIEFAPCDEDLSDGFIDDDPNGMQNPEDDLNNGENEEKELSPEVQKIILEPLKKEESTAETPLNDNKEVTPNDTKDLPAVESKEVKEEKKLKGNKSKSE